VELPFQILRPGRLAYEEGLALQDDLVSRRQQGAIPDTLVLLDHEPVYTIGRTRDQSSLRTASLLPHPVHITNRGGHATYHGPGQLVGYPILDLNTYGRDLHRYLRILETSLIALCQSYGLKACQRKDLTGVWVENRKIASIGVGVRRWISMHGFALNVSTESLPPFRAIIPCGITAVQMTCLDNECPNANPDLNQVATDYPAFLAQSLAAPS